jgi:TetR/AcrR family transcriptional regulator, cholesterol catabolism regulator
MMKPQKKLAKMSEPDRRAEIYNAAAKIICEKGFDAMTMNDIAQAVGMTKAGIYHYINGKKDMLYAVMSYGMDSLENNVIAPASVCKDAQQRLREIISNHARLISTGQNTIAIVVDEVTGLAPAHRKKINQRKRLYLDFIRDTLKQLKEEGRLKDVDVTVAAFSILGMILWLSRWYRQDGKLNSEEVTDEILKIALGGVLRAPLRPVKRPSLVVVKE